MIGHNQRFVSSHQKAKEIIETGELGKIYSFRTTFGHGGPEQWSAEGEDSWFFKKDEAFIGAMGDLGVHKADLLRYLLGEEFIDVSAIIETSAKEKDRKSTRLNSSHVAISYAVFCLKKKKIE